MRTIQERCPPGGDILEYGCFLIEDEMEVPASAERPDGRLDTVTFPAYNFDFNRAICAVWVCGGYLMRSQFLIGRFHHFELRNKFSAFGSKTKGVKPTCLGRSTHNCKPRGSGAPGVCTGISAWIMPRPYH
jgi:hypothetical protein